MNFSISDLFAGLIFGVIGFWLLKEGKRRANIPVIIAGVALIGFTYFTPTPLADWGVGVVLCGVAYYLWNNEIF